MHRRGAGLAITAVVLVAVAGCGSSSDDSSSAPSSASTSATASAQTVAWADQLCSAASTWKGQLSTATSRLGDTANLSVNGVRSSLTSMATATGDFADDLRSLGSPGTQAGDQAQQDLSDLGDSLDAQQQKISDTLAGVTTARQLVSALPALTTSLSAMGAAFGSTADQLSTLDGGAELEAAFQASTACQEVGIG
jgi:hypothetical protein